MTNIWTRFNSVMLVLVFLALLTIIAMLARDAYGGSLDPPGAPSSTGRPLDELTGAWSRKLTSTNGASGPIPPAGCGSDRFKCVFFGTTIGSPPTGVLDLETGLVWERSPSAVLAIWGDARGNCEKRLHSNRFGWRLPTEEEMKSLADDSADGLPDGHPFTNVSLTSEYWTDSSYSATFAFLFQFDTANGETIDMKSTSHLAWCVRGGSSYDTVS
jgi:hypothetical protein